MNRFNGGTTTYEFSGSGIVQIKQNSDADEKRFCTLQVVVRCVDKGMKQPRLTIIFRGQGKRLTQEERELWDKRVHVTFQPKAWADSDWCVEWGVTEFRRIMDEFVPKDCRGLAILDNLYGQTTKPFVDALSKGRADTHFGLGGATHLWQVVDDGVGHMLKAEMSEILDERLQSDHFHDEWTSGVMSASRVRVLTTEMAGEAWERVQQRLDAARIFRNKGWAMTTSDENDELKIHGLPEYNWHANELADQSVDESADESADESDEDAVEELVAEDESDGEMPDETADSDVADESSDEDEVDPGPWRDTDEHSAITEYRKPKAKLVIAHKFFTEVGWEVGTIMRKSGKYWLVKYESETELYKHELRKADYGPTWLALKAK